MDYVPRSLWDPIRPSPTPRFAHLEPPAELAIDTETTGLGDDRRLLELAVIAAKTGDVVMHQFFNPGVPSDPGALRVHRLD
jgi:DNA polymerase III epsilon subunit-like protein